MSLLELLGCHGGHLVAQNEGEQNGFSKVLIKDKQIGTLYFCPVSAAEHSFFSVDLAIHGQQVSKYDLQLSLLQKTTTEDDDDNNSCVSITKSSRSDDKHVHIQTQCIMIPQGKWVEPRLIITTATTVDSSSNSSNVVILFLLKGTFRLVPMMTMMLFNNINSVAASCHWVTLGARINHLFPNGVFMLYNEDKPQEMLTVQKWWFEWLNVRVFPLSTVSHDNAADTKKQQRYLDAHSLLNVPKQLIKIRFGPTAGATGIFVMNGSVIIRNPLEWLDRLSHDHDHIVVACYSDDTPPCCLAAGETIEQKQSSKVDCESVLPRDFYAIMDNDHIMMLTDHCVHIVIEASQLCLFECCNLLPTTTKQEELKFHTLVRLLQAQTWKHWILHVINAPVGSKSCEERVVMHIMMDKKNHHHHPSVKECASTGYWLTLSPQPDMDGATQLMFTKTNTLARLVNAICNNNNNAMAVLSGKNTLRVVRFPSHTDLELMDLLSSSMGFMSRVSTLVQGSSGNPHLLALDVFGFLCCLAS
jgi:hypothetical protein